MKKTYYTTRTPLKGVQSNPLPTPWSQYEMQKKKKMCEFFLQALLSSLGGAGELGLCGHELLTLALSEQ